MAVVKNPVVIVLLIFYKNILLLFFFLFLYIQQLTVFLVCGLVIIISTNVCHEMSIYIYISPQSYKISGEQLETHSFGVVHVTSIFRTFAVHPGRFGSNSEF